MLLQVPFSKKVTVACAWSPCGGKRCRCLDIVWLSRYSSEPPGKQGPGIETHFLRTALHCSGDPCPSLEGRVRRQGRCLRGLTMVTPSPSGRMSPGVMKLSRRVWGSEIISRFCHKWEILRGSRAGRGTRHRHQGQNPNINGLPKCALIRQLSWHKECAHAHNSNVPLLPCQLAFSWWSNRAGSSRHQDNIRDRGGGPGSWRKEAASIYINVPN